MPKRTPAKRLSTIYILIIQCVNLNAIKTTIYRLIMFVPTTLRTAIGCLLFLGNIVLGNSDLLIKLAENSLLMQIDKVFSSLNIPFKIVAYLAAKIATTTAFCRVNLAWSARRTFVFTKDALILNPCQNCTWSRRPFASWQFNKHFLHEKAEIPRFN